jgi:capsular exopolysaccharide synthesis family protein
VNTPEDSLIDDASGRAGNFLHRTDESALHPPPVDARVVSLTAPASVAAEQYRSLYYRLEHHRERRPMKLVAFTSAVSGEGKTVTAVNLALTGARANPDRRILLMDADLRRGQVAELLGFRARPGLSELLQGEAELRAVVRRFKANRLAVIPAGQGPEEPTQLLAGRRMKELLRGVREGFDEVYLDLPPTLPFADAAILGSLSDAVVLVVRANATPGKHIQQALDHLLGSSVLGCVLNGATPSSTPYLKAYLR